MSSLGDLGIYHYGPGLRYFEVLVDENGVILLRKECSFSPIYIVSSFYSLFARYVALKSAVMARDTIVHKE